MTNKKQETYSFMLILAVVCVGIMYNANTGFVVLVNSIAGDFFSRGIALSSVQISMILSLPTLLMIPGVLLSGKLSQHISIRTIAVISWIIFGVTSVLLYLFSDNIQAFLIIRAFMGLGIGLCQPVSRTIPSKLFEGPMRSKVIGYISMGGGILSVAMSLGFGWMALTDWRRCLLLFPILSVIFVILALAFIPAIPPERNENVARGGRGPVGRPVLLLCLAGFCIYTIGAVIQVKTSVHVVQAGIGGSDFAGYVSSASTFGIIIGGFVFGTVYEKLGRKILPVASLIVAVFYYLFAWTDNFWVMAVSSFAIGLISIGILMPYLMARVSFVAPKKQVSRCISMVTLSCYIGQFLTTYFISGVERLFQAPLIDTGTGAQPLASVSLYAVAVGYVVIGIAGALIMKTERD